MGLDKAYKPLNIDEDNATIINYRESVGIDDAAMPTSEPYDTYEKNRLCEAKGFSSLESKLSKSTKKGETDAVRTKISKALELTPEIKDQSEINKKYLELIKDKVNDPTESFTPHKMIVSLSVINRHLEAKILKQHEVETKEIENLFNTTKFVDELKASAGITTDDEVKAVKEDMLKTLKDSQKAELTKFEESKKATENKILQSAAEYFKNIIWAKKLNEVDKKAFEALRAQRQTSSSVTARQEKETDSDYYKGVLIENLTTFKTNSGLDISHEKGKGFHVSFPSGFRWGLTHPFKSYYPERYKQDWMSIIQAFQATGSKTATISFNFQAGRSEDAKTTGENREKMLQYARIAFEAALESGFNDQVKEKLADGKEKSQLTIIVNGEELSADKLYPTSELQTRLQAARLKAQENATSRKEAIDKAMEANKAAASFASVESKDLLQKVIAEHKASKAPAAPSSTTPGSTTTSPTTTSSATSPPIT